MSEDKIVNRYYIKGKLHATSPLNIGSGETNYSENDLMRDWEQKVFIPGPTLAGAIRSHLFDSLYIDELPEDKIKKDEDKIIREIFGYHETEENNETFQSLIIFYDSYLEKDSDIKVRDGVKLDEFTRVSEEQKKYDYEVLEPGAIFDFKLELLTRQKHSNKTRIQDIKEILYYILKFLQEGQISFGARTSRGFGQLILKDLKIQKIDVENEPQKWVDFSWESLTENTELDDLNHGLYQNCLKKTFSIDVNFVIPSSLLIRSYNPLPGDVDVVHLRSNGEDIIPGTSWTGALHNSIYNLVLALRKDMEKMSVSKETLKDKIDKIVDKLFGYVKEEKKEVNRKINAQASRLIIGESIIEKNIDLRYTRTKVDRFTGGVVQGALFSEGYSYQGEVSLNLKIKNFEDYHIGLLLLAISELWYGLQPIGGTTSIGRGILQGKELYLNGFENKFETLEALEIQNYIQKFAEELIERIN